MRRRASPAFAALAPLAACSASCALPIGELPRLELQIAERAPALIGLVPCSCRSSDRSRSSARLLRALACRGSCRRRSLAAPRISSDASRSCDSGGRLSLAPRGCPLPTTAVACRLLALGIAAPRRPLLLSALAFLRLLPRLLLADLPCELLRLLPQLRLLAREPLEAPLQFFGAQALPLAGEVFLLARELLLASRQLAHAVERIVLRCRPAAPRCSSAFRSSSAAAAAAPGRTASTDPAASG